MNRFHVYFRILLFLSVLFPSIAMAHSHRAVDIYFETVKGESIQLSDLKGKVVLVNFWATWCPPCREEIPALVRLQKKYADRGLVVVGVDYNENPGRERLEEFLDGFEVNYPVIYGDRALIQQLARELGGVFGLPTNKLLSRSGELVSTSVGGLNDLQLSLIVEPAL